MKEKEPGALHVKPRHYRTADLVIAVAFLLAGILGGYFAIVQNVRDYWLLLVVGIIGALLMFRRASSEESAS